MKRSELKKILKPLVSECIKESLMEDGLISSVITEVVRGMSVATAGPPQVADEPPKKDIALERIQRNAFSEKQSGKLKEHRAKLMSAIGGESYNGVNLFEGTTPAPAQASHTQQSSPLSGQSPADPGVDITNLFGAVGSHWNAHMNTTDHKERK
jgi:hypothetical protein